ncbi:SAM-dependent methyltransferase [Methylomonas sp. LL1]|uniref:SAM-dependent methyltransferase n=1 Tax=Methylomonas sp. LL1 TaxID=2785785 RepID=UPI0018C4276F|nr:SAM-dependent methyltransferase [Methylomonas sp. LL1]QPK64904.1 SAM-dependent methyltransferase [Methylomonas sp. LL1]
MNTKPPFAMLFSVGMISAAALAYEVLLMRLFAIIQWHHFAFMVISLALLGYGVSGAVLALKREWLMQHFARILVANMLLFAAAAPLCFQLAQAIPFNPAEMLWAPVQWLYLCAIYLLLAIPFFFAANVIGSAFYQYRDRVSSVYAADLLGAGAGSLGIILLLFLIFPQKILTVPIVLAMAAALIAANYGLPEKGTMFGAWFSAPVILGVAVIFMLTEFMTLNVSPYKGLNQLLRVPGTKIIARDTSPLGLLSVVSSGITPLRHAPGLSLNATAEPPEQLAVFIDADNISAITRYNGNPASVSYLDQTTSALPYHLNRIDDILILGAGTGSDILQARYHGVNQIDAVELNGRIVALVKEKYADFSGHIYASPGIKVHVDDARGYLATTNKTHKLVNISLLDGFGSAAGLYSLAENYLYTEQAIRDYLRHLSPDGFLSITRWIKVPPRDEVKLLATVIAALKKAGIQQPGQQMLMIRGWQTSTLLIKNGVITRHEIDSLKQFCQARGFDPVYYPGIAEAEVNRFNMQQQPYLYRSITALLGDDSRAFMAAYKFNVEVATDDKPYLFHFFKWETLPEVLPLLRSGGGFLLESGYLLLVAALAQAIFASLILIGLPLCLCGNKLGIQPGSSNHLNILLYFFCLGLAFLFIEIAFIQKFVLILHHPLYAVTVVLGTFLLSAGAGSHYSRKYPAIGKRPPVLMPIAAIAGLSLLYVLNFEAIGGFVLGLGLVGRYLLSVLLIAPLGFCMGMPFPMALARLSQTAPALIPWAWGINGCASVISAILATLIAMQFGFTALIMLAIGFYGLALWCFPTLAR